MPYSLKPLPFAENALEPHMSARTIQFHYGKHHKAYVDKLNDLVANTPLEKKTLHDLVRDLNGQRGDGRAMRQRRGLTGRRRTGGRRGRAGGRSEKSQKGEAPEGRPQPDSAGEPNSETDSMMPANQAQMLPPTVRPIPIQKAIQFHSISPMPPTIVPAMITNTAAQMEALAS